MVVCVCVYLYFLFRPDKHSLPSHTLHSTSLDRLTSLGSSLTRATTRILAFGTPAGSQSPFAATDKWHVAVIYHVQTNSKRQLASVRLPIRFPDAYIRFSSRDALPSTKHTSSPATSGKWGISSRRDAISTLRTRTRTT